MISRESVQSVPEWLQDTFFMMVVSNSCVNPIVYGSFAINCKYNCKCCCCFGKGAVNKKLSEYFYFNSRKYWLLKRFVLLV